MNSFHFQQTIANWRYVFIIGIGVYVAGAISFCLFASGEIQPWNEHWVEEDKEELVDNNRQADREENENQKPTE